MTLGFTDKQAPAKVPNHAINWGPSNAIIELLGSRLTTNWLLDDGLDEPSHSVQHDVAGEEPARNEAISLGWQGYSSHFVSQEPD